MADPAPPKAKPKPKGAARGDAGKAPDTVKILGAIPEAQRLLALAFLIGQAILTAVYFKAPEAAQPYALGAVLAWPFVILVAAVLVYLRSFAQVRTSVQEAQTSTGVDGAAPRVDGYDLFVSAPMDALENDQAYAQNKDVVLRVMEAFKQNAKMRTIYFGGGLPDSRAQFDDESQGYEAVRAALEGSRNYVLIWPAKVSSSALVELGIAAQRKLPTVIFRRKPEDLPYLLRGKLKSGTGDGWPVKAYDYTDLESLKKTIQLAGEGLFPKRPG